MVIAVFITTVAVVDEVRAAQPQAKCVQGARRYSTGINNSVTLDLESLAHRTCARPLPTTAEV